MAGNLAATVIRYPMLAKLKRWFPGLLPANMAPDHLGLLRDFLLLGGILFALTLLAFGCTVSWDHAIPRDRTGLALGRDFLNFWVYGRAAVMPDPGRFYDPAIYNHELSELAGPGLPGQNWSYPPSVMLLAAPFGQLSYLAALLSWSVLGVTVFVAAAKRQVADWRILLPIVLSPAAMFCLISGQSSFVTAGALLAIFAWLDRKPVAAGILIGLLSIKPQLGLLFPFMLAASGRWKVFACAAVTTVALIGITAMLFGVQVWVDFITRGLPVQNAVLSDPNLIATPFYPTVFMNIRGLDVSYAVAMAAQSVVSLGAIGAVIWAFRFRRDADPDALRALFLACTAAASPYLLIYDLLPLTCAAVMLLATMKPDPLRGRLIQLVYWTPMLQLGFGAGHVPGPGLIAPAFAIHLIARLARPASRKAVPA